MSDPQAPTPAASTFDWVALYNQGAAAFGAGRIDEAVNCFIGALRVNPTQPQTLTSLGIALRMQGRRDDAVNVLTEAARVRPDHDDTLMHLASAQQEARRLNDALQTGLRLSARNPAYPGLNFLLGTLYLHHDQQDLAIRHYRRAVVEGPDQAVHYNNYGAALTSNRRQAEGCGAYRRAILLEPSSPEYNKNLGCALLMDGHYAEGWPYYEWRVKQSVWKWNRQFPGKPQWDGGPLNGKTILVHFEQGLGDSFQYGRYMQVLKSMGARVIFECQPQLKRVLSSLPGVDALVAHGEPLPDFDVWVSLMSLMLLLKTDDRNVPAASPYLWAEPALKDQWRARMNLNEFRIGVNWQGNETAKSIPLDFFPAIAAIPGVRLYSLQKVKGLEHLERLRDRLPLIDWTGEMDVGSDGFIDTAAVMSNMDMIVTCDTSIAHLSGALGLRTWMVLKWLPDWRWEADRPDCPWYPSTRLFRMAQKNDWAEVMGRLTGELARVVAAERPAVG